MTRDTVTSRFLQDAYRIIPSAFVGILIGIVLATFHLRPHPPLEIIEDAGEPDVPVVTLFGIRDGALHGQTRGTVRVVAGTHLIPADGSGNFLITDREILTNIVGITAPAGMRFVASHRGEKYYSIGDARAAQIIPENRLYFPDAASAERAGYAR